ncbi:recombinase family protein [Christensenellaceae bacterium OttesenSCG-928-M15]|nr:recombinase family protein [Christensenellaceae bacterium OttesenSCG-928-M15]
MKAAIYCRLSEEDRVKAHALDESRSMQNQRTMLLQFAAKEGIEVYEIYSDEDYAGADRNRPAFNRLLKDAALKKFDVVLCKSQSRFTRELEIVEKYIHGYFEEWGIRFISLVDHADTAVKSNKKSRQINGLINEWYLEDLSENIKKTLIARRQAGYFIGAFAPYGYQKDPAQRGRLMIDEEAAQIVREIYRLYLDGYGKTAIARLLNARGIPNPSEYKRQKGLRYKQPENKRGSLWKYHTVSDILQNETYIGNLVQGRYKSISYKTHKNRPVEKEDWIRAENTHEPIVTAEIFARAKALANGGPKAGNNGKSGLFTGKVFCVHCGYRLRVNRQRQKDEYLQCPTRFISASQCGGAFISIKKLEGIVLDELRHFYEHFGGRNVPWDAMKKEAAMRPRPAVDRTPKKKRLAQYEEALRLLYMDRAAGLVDETVFLNLRKELGKERLLLEEDVGGMDAFDEGREEESAREDLFKGPLSGKMLEAFVERIEVGWKGEEERRAEVRIYWKF